MNITSMTISNFKGIKDELKIDFKPITLLFGPNSAGKSTIIQALHYAWEVIGRHNLSPKATEYGGQSIDLGGFGNIVYGHDKSRSIKMRFDLDLNGVSLDLFADEDLKDSIDTLEGRWEFYRWNPSIISDIKTAAVEINISWYNNLDQPFVTKYAVYFNEEIIGSMQSDPDTGKTWISYINFCHPSFLSNKFYYLEEQDRDNIEEIIINAMEQINSWLVVSKISNNQYINLKEACDNFLHTKNLTDKYLPLITDLAIKKKNNTITIAELSELERIEQEFIEGPLKQRDIIFKKLLSYEFWFYSRILFNLETLGDQISIECEGLKDALPNWDSLLSIKNYQTYEYDQNKKQYHEVTNTHFGFAQSALCQVFLGPGKILRNELKRLLYLGPIRNRIPRNYEPESFIDNTRWSEGLAAWDVLYKESQDFFDKLNFWLGDRLRTGYVLKKESNAQIKIIDENNFELRPIDVGVGLSQILPVIVASLYVKEGLIAIEQPELHIHPALQVDLGDLMISEISRKDVCFLIETHSEHLLLRILKRIRQSNENHSDIGLEISPDDVAVYFVEATSNGTKAVRIRIDEDGDFVDSWPKGFFEERMMELM